MKEVKRIHLARISYDIEINAKKQLEAYLNAIQKTMKADDDTMHEIELRMIELLNDDGVRSGQAIKSSDVDLLIEKLGKPGDFSDDNAGGDSEEVAFSDKKRLMRDLDRAWLGGVCAGVAAYFGINPLWIRLLAIVSPFISLGTSILIYIVLWIALPPAKSASDKLEMKGDPVTLGGIKEIRSQAAKKVSATKRPLVIVLRVLMGVFLAVSALAAVVILTMVISIGVSALATNSLVVESPLLALAGGLGVVSIILFILLIFMLLYAVIRWGVTKRLAIAMIAVVVSGVLFGGVAFGVSAFAVGSATSIIESKTQTSSMPIDLNGVKDLVVDSDKSVKYIVKSGSPEVRIKHLGQINDVNSLVEVSRHGDKAEINIEKTGPCGMFSVDNKCIFTPEVTIYGPKLDNIEVVSGNMTYGTDSQAKLSAYVHENSHFKIDRGVVDNFSLKIDDISCQIFSNFMSVSLNGVHNLTLNGESYPLEPISKDCFQLTFN